MVISNIGSTYDFSALSRYRRDIPTVSEEEVRKQDAINADDNIEITPARKLYGAKEAGEYALNSELKVDRSLIGSDKDINKLDIRQAVSDIQTDSLLNEYTYFVGNISTEDGSVTRKIS